MPTETRKQSQRQEGEPALHACGAFLSLGLLISLPSLSDATWTNHNAKAFWKLWETSIFSASRDVAFVLRAEHGTCDRAVCVALGLLGCRWRGAYHCLFA
jgi:hypothetical protein